jgi:hypothetical protein
MASPAYTPVKALKGISMGTGSSNLFGTFLDTFSRDPASAKPADSPQPIDAILKTLNTAQTPLTLAELMPATNHSADVLLESIDKLLRSGMIERTKDDRVVLTPQGRMLAALTR